MNSTDVPTVNRLLELGAKIGVPFNAAGVSGEPLVLVPSGMDVKSLAGFLPPSRIKRSVTLLDASSFIDYVNRFKTDNTLIFARVSETGATFQAMLDYHSAAPELKADYCDHVATFPLMETPEWKAWLAADRKLMTQVDFATWLEDNQKLFVEPAGAELLELVRTLHGHKNASFKTAIRLDNGSHSASYDEEVVIKGVATAKSEALALPPQISAGMAVFQGAAPYKIKARLKCRVENRQLYVFFETIAKHEIVRESILLAVKQVAEKTEIVPLLGNP